MCRVGGPARLFASSVVYETRVSDDPIDAHDIRFAKGTRLCFKMRYVLYCNGTTQII